MQYLFHKKTLTAVKTFARAHKIASGAILIVALLIAYYGYSKLTGTAGETRYILAAAKRGTIIVSVTGSGQVSAENQIDLKPKASGTIIYIPATEGMEINAGGLVAEIDPKNAEKVVRDAEVSLQSAQLTLQKLVQPADTLSRIQTENALTQAKTGLDKAYEDGFSIISNAFLDLPTIMAGLQDILYGTTVIRGTDNVAAYADMVHNYDETVYRFRDDAVTKYQAARAAYDKNFLDYKAASRSSDRATVDALLRETYATTKTLSGSVKSMSDLLNFVKDRLVEHQNNIPALLTTHQNILNTYTSETNSHVLNLFNIINTIITANFSIAEKTAALKKLTDGADPLDVASQKLAVTQRENALLDAKNTLADYFIRVPFDGTVAKINVKKFDDASSGTTIATLITRQKIAELSLNEVDATKIKVGDKVTLTFDAIDGLSITGKVAEMDTLGTVTQGVVTYNVKISFDTDDARVKPGMSVNAAIVTDVKQDVLTVPASAVKSKNGGSYVEMFDQTPAATAGAGQGVVSPLAPRQQPVEVGLSSDTDTEIVSGLSEGDLVVVRTIAPTSQTPSATAPSIFGAAGGNRGGGGGAVRGIQGR